MSHNQIMDFSFSQSSTIMVEEQKHGYELEEEKEHLPFNISSLSLHQQDEKQNQVYILETSPRCSPPEEEESAAAANHEDEMKFLNQQNQHISQSDLMKPMQYFSSNLNVNTKIEHQPEEESPSSVLSTPIGGGKQLSLTPYSKMQPVLYSAINSLEKATAGSFGKVRSMYKEHAGRRDFQSHRVATETINRDLNVAKITLIPPKSTISNVLFANATSENRNVEEKTSEHDYVTTEEPVKDSWVGEEEKSVQILVESNNKPLRKASSHGQLSDIDRTSNQNVPSNPEEFKEKRSKETRMVRKRRRRRVAKPVELFRPSCDAYTPRIGDGYLRSGKDIKFRPAESRGSLTRCSMGTLSRPNFRDALRRVAMIIQQHVVKIERRFEATAQTKNSGLFKASMMEEFSQYNFCSPRHKCTMVRLPMARPGMLYGMREIQINYDKIPSEEEIYEFGHRLFQKVQLSSECSIVCLIYVERLMEVAKVPLVARTWQTVFMCGLLLASKVWQDLSSWNIEFASVYPQFSLEQINRLEVLFLKNIKWDLYISSSLYAKYYFALRSLLEKQDFRNRYNRMILGQTSAAEKDLAQKVQQRSEQMKEEALLQLSRSM